MGGCGDDDVYWPDPRPDEYDPCVARWNHVCASLSTLSHTKTKQNTAGNWRVFHLVRRPGLERVVAQHVHNSA